MRNFSETLVREYGARLIRINPREAQDTREGSVTISAGALAEFEALNALMGG